MKGKAWPFIVGGLLVFGVGVDVGFLIVATRDPSFAVEDDYYGRALRWDETTRDARRSAELGWSIGIETVPSPSGRGRTDLSLVVLDRDGAPVSGAAVSVEAFHHARAGERLAAELVADGGRYRATLPLRRAGVWQLRVRVDRGGQRFSTVIDREIGGTR